MLLTTELKTVDIFRSTAIRRLPLEQTRDGMLLIERNGKTYNAQGVEVR